MMGQCWRWGVWVRVFGYGVVIRREQPLGLLYSERTGRARVFQLAGWVIKPLGRATWVS